MRTSVDRTVGALLLLGSVGPTWSAVVRPEESHVPLKVEQRARINFPSRALTEGASRGEVVLMLDVSETGEVGDTLAVEYTRRDFAEAALDAVKRWRFIPGRVNGRPIGSYVTVAIRFEVSGVLAYVKPVHTKETEGGSDDGSGYRPVNVAMLDRVPAALAREGPIYPREWIQQGRTGSVTVEFFIDEQGKVRFPRAIGDADEWLAGAALAAVSDWRFESPMRNGQPVLVRAQQVFDFRVPPRATGR